MQGELPGAYRLVEYLESSGTQYIDISSIEKPYAFDVLAMIINARTNGAMLTGFSLWNDSSATCIWQSSVYIGVSRKRDSQAHSALANAPDMLNKKLRFICSTQNAILIDADANTEIARNTDIVSDLLPFPVNLFHGMSNGAYKSRYIPARVYSAKWYLNNTKVFDLIPCVRKADNKPGMYDTVTKTFYTNTGTGEFIVPA